MWSDSVSEIDMLAYEPYAQLLYEIAISERLNPLTIGLFGRWGSGKSTLLELVDKKIKKEHEKNIVSIKVNAWIYEGYDDAKAALMADILRTVNDKIPEGTECKNKLFKLLKRVDWLRFGTTATKKGIPLLFGAATGNPIPFILNSLKDLGDIDWSDENKIDEVKNKIFNIRDYVKDEDKKEDVVENIRTFRKEFEKLIDDSKIDNLIIMVDDLDRCNPDRIIETIEAIKLFLAVKKTTFIIAIDDEVLRYAIRKKYPRLDNDISSDISEDYIEKIIQLPIELPDLSDIDIKNYMLLLISEMFINEEYLNKIIEGFKSKNIFTKGEIISLTDIDELLEDGDEEEIYKDVSNKGQFYNYIGLFNKIGDIVAGALKGNPRQTKRFLNTFFIRKRLAEIQNIKLDEAILAKLMVLEYAYRSLFRELYGWQFKGKGKPEELKEIEDYVLNGEKDEDIENKYKQWLGPRVKDWILLEPSNLSESDLRQYFYLARESVKDQKLSMLNIKSELRQKVNEICNVDLDSSLRAKLIESLKAEGIDIRNDAYVAIVSKFTQDHGGIKKVLLDFIKIMPEYTEKAIEEFKKLQKKEIDPGFVMQLNSGFDGEQSLRLKELVDYYTKHDLFDKKVLDMIEKMNTRRK